MKKLNEEVLEKAYEWVYQNSPENLCNDGFIIGVYKAMMNELEKEDI